MFYYVYTILLQQQLLLLLLLLHTKRKFSTVKMDFVARFHLSSFKLQDELHIKGCSLMTSSFFLLISPTPLKGWRHLWTAPTHNYTNRSSQEVWLKKSTFTDVTFFYSLQYNNETLKVTLIIVTLANLSHQKQKKS